MKSSKKYNIIITGNHRAPIKKLTISRSWIHFSLFIFGLFVLIMLSMVGDYFRLIAQNNENKILRLKNEQMEMQYDRLITKLESLELQVERVKSLSTKLKAITDVSDEDREMDLVFNTEPRPGDTIYPSEQEAEMAAERKSASLASSSGGVTGLSFFRWPILARSPNAIQSTSTQFFSDLEVRIWDSSKTAQNMELELNKLWDDLSERRDLLDYTPSIVPAIGWISSQFGYRNDPFTGRVILHKGLDIAASVGTPVMAPASGVVSYVGYESGYGKIVSIDHGFGVVTRFAHNSKVFVKLGQKVKRREKISAVGSTGRSTGPHVHYEVRVNGIPVDPKNYILD